MRRKTKRHVIIGAITIILGILSFFMYQSYAYYKVNYTENIINTNVGEFGIYNYAYTGTAQEFTVPVTGYYNIEAWGASAVGSYSGYTSGIIYLDMDEKIYLYVGEQGKTHNTSCSTTAYNGGGGRDYFDSVCGASGGGATDIRLVNGVWNNSDSLRSRIMVAGAGGGGNPHTGGMGGSLIAGNGIDATYQQYQGQGGSQITGGKAPTMYTTAQSNGTVGIFGTGGIGGKNNSGSSLAGGAGGGAGYYGGSGASGKGNGMWAGGGGSSYISGYAGVNSVQQTGGTIAQPLHTNNTIHYSGKYFIKGIMESGVNTGNGKAKITYVGSTIPTRTNTNLDNVRYIKACASGNNSNGYKNWLEIQAIKNGINLALNKTIVGTAESNILGPYSYVIDGMLDNGVIGYTSYTGLQCVIVDLGSVQTLDEIVLWQNIDRVYYDNVLSVGSVDAGGTTSLSTILHNYQGTTGYLETSQGKRYTAWD